MGPDPGNLLERVEGSHPGDVHGSCSVHVNTTNIGTTLVNSP